MKILIFKERKALLGIILENKWQKKGGNVCKLLGYK